MKRKNLVLILIVLIVFIGGLLFIWKINNNQREKEQPIPELGEKANIQDYETKKYEPFALDARAAISILITPEGDSQILFEKNTDEELPIASLAKLMTAYVVLEYYNLSHKTEISEQAILQAGDTGKLKVGQKLPIKDLLFPLLIESSNDAAFALAEMIGKEHFVFLMNLKAEQLGLKNTYFVNPTGLDEKKTNNYSTVNDLVKFTKYLLSFEKNELIWDILSTKEINLYGQTLINTNQLLGKIPGIIGGKTGETPKAGQNLLLVVNIPQDRGYLINIVLGSENRFKKMIKMIDWIMKNEWEIDNKWKSKEALLTWKEVISDAPWGERDAHASIVFQNKIWLLGGLSGKEDFDGIYKKLPHKSDIWVSENGKNWRLITDNASWGKRRSLQMVEFQNKLWLIGGWEKKSNKTKNDVWSSYNGINWVKEVSSAPWPAREGHTIAVFNDKIWIIGGVDFTQRKTMNDVWHSKDGINWTQSTNAAVWLPRYDHTITVFQGKMWLIGGLDLHRQIKNDIWISENGKDWKLVTDNAPWPKRHGHTSNVFKDKIWIIGGWGFREGLNDVWYSKDGSIWQPTLVRNQWAGREDHTSVVFKDKIWIMGGMSDNWKWKSDIWHSVF